MSSTAEDSDRSEPAPPEVVNAFKLLFDALLRKLERERGETGFGKAKGDE